MGLSWIYNYNVPMQSAPINADAVGSTPAQGKEYNIMW